MIVSLKKNRRQLEKNSISICKTGSFIDPCLPPFVRLHCPNFEESDEVEIDLKTFSFIVLLRRDVNGIFAHNGINDVGRFLEAEIGQTHFGSKGDDEATTHAPVCVSPQTKQGRRGRWSSTGANKSGICTRSRHALVYICLPIPSTTVVQQY